jgi:hypothetical protein
MTTKLLYYGSLEKHMDSYMNQVKQTELNEQFQIAQNKIIREGELMNLSQADIMNKLKQLQEDLKNQVAQTIIIPLSKTNASELVKQEEKMPMSFDNESGVIKKAPYKVENRRGLIDELDKKLKSRKKNDVETLSKIAKNESERDNKKATKTLFQQELEAKLKNRFDTFSQATTASTTSSSSSTSPKSFTKLHPAQATAQLRAEFTAKGKAWPYGKGNVSYANMIKAREQLGQGLKKKK